MVRTKTNIQFIESILSIFLQWEHDGKDYIEYLRTVKGGDEFDIRDWFVKPIFEKLGYEKGDFNHEHPLFSGKPDFFIKPSLFHPIITVETKPSTVKQKDFAEARSQQLFPAMKELYTPAGVLTNGVRFEVYHQVGKIYQRVIELDFSSLIIAYKKKGIDGLDNEHYEKLIKLLWLKRSNQAIKDEDFYPPPEVDISEPTQFEMLLDDLASVVEMVKIDVEERFDIFLTEYTDCEERAKNLFGYELKQLQKEKRDAIKTKKFYDKWAQINSIDINKNDTAKGKFITETMYILVNRILLIRIAEDKGIIKRRISNGAIKDYKEYVRELRINYNKLLDEGYRTIEAVYEHLFKRDIFDWYNPDSELLMKALFTFNRYNFAKVSRDILGNLYQKYIDKEERKRLGQFYTPHEMVDYILDAVGYTVQNDIENKTLLDPACGSGGFLVPVVNRLVARLRNKNFDATTIFEKVKNNIYGFDINPFAAHLTETNLLFQVIDLIGEAKENNQNFKMEKFNICVTDTLRASYSKETVNNLDFFIEPEEESIAAEDVEVVKEIKSKQGKFSLGLNFIVGNPPYVTNYAKHSKKIPQKYLNELKPTYDFSRNRPSNRYNLIMFFLEKGLSLIGEGSSFGMIVDESSFSTTLYNEIRKYILEHCCVISILSNLEAFEDVNTKQMILILQKESDEKKRKLNKIIWKVKHADDLIKETKIDQGEWLTNRNYSFEPPNIFESILHKLEKGKPLHLLYDPISGMNVTNRPESGLKSFLSNERLDSTYHKAIFSGNIKKYEIEWPIPEQESPNSRKMLYISFDKQLASEINSFLERKKEKARVSIGENDERYKKPKIFIRQSLPGNGRITAALSNDVDEYCDNSAYVINQKRGEYSLEYLLAILNSSLITFWAQQRNVLSKGSTGSAKRLPMGSKGLGFRDFPIIADSTDEQKEIIKLVKNMISISQKLGDNFQLENNPNNFLKNINFREKIISLSDVNFLKYVEIKGNLGKPRIERTGKRVYLSRTNFIDLSDENAAIYVERYLLGIEDLLRGMTKTEVLRTIKIPQKTKDIEIILHNNEELKKIANDLEKKKSQLEEELNQKVYDLYGISKDERKLIEEKIVV